MSEKIEEFRIEIPESQLDDLRARLAATNWPAPLPGDGWDTGVPVAWLRGLADYWRTGYDWRAAEAKINRFPGYVTKVDGQRIHFLHVRSANPGALPLILTHGWPGSIAEFLDVIEPLSEDFHVVVPSLPGFGFSGPVTEPGWDTTRIARTWDELMRRLGYDRYGTQGGDIGGAVAPEMARVAPDRVVGVHVNGDPGPMPDLPLSDDEYASLKPAEQERVDRIGAFMQEEFGYIAIQSTRPQALAYGLVDSPAGQLAWIMDKFREWTYPRATEPDRILDRDVLLTNVMFYWLTGTAGSAAYVGYAQAGGWGEPAANSGVPTAVMNFAHDVGIRRYAERAHTIVRWTELEGRGGHFAALEEPELLVSDIRSFFGSLR
jgi:pimeloyl-ACP methyl ester carboxylesterase